MIPCRAGCIYTAVGQFAGLWWMDNRRYVVSVVSGPKLYTLFYYDVLH